MVSFRWLKIWTSESSSVMCVAFLISICPASSLDTNSFAAAFRETVELCAAVSVDCGNCHNDARSPAEADEQRNHGSLPWLTFRWSLFNEPLAVGSGRSKLDHAHDCLFFGDFLLRNLLRKE